MSEPLTDAELDEVLAKAHAELLAWVERHTPRAHIAEFIARLTEEQR
ncbi:hypothetical protein [Nonomuraea sp. CA-141351]